MTVAAEFHTKQFDVRNTPCLLQIFDIGGQERFRHLVKQYLNGAKGALLLFDVTHMPSFVNVGKWVKILRSKNSKLPIILVGTKADLEGFSVVADYLAILTQKRFNLYYYIKTSSKLGLNVDSAFEILTERILDAGNI